MKKSKYERKRREFKQKGKIEWLKEKIFERKKEKKKKLGDYRGWEKRKKGSREEILLECWFYFMFIFFQYKLLVIFIFQFIQFRDERRCSFKI